MTGEKRGSKWWLVMAAFSLIGIIISLTVVMREFKTGKARVFQEGKTLVLEEAKLQAFEEARIQAFDEALKTVQEMPDPDLPIHPDHPKTNQLNE